MSTSDELYDVVKRLQKTFPRIISVIPVNTFYSDDLYEVMRSLLVVAQEKIDFLEQDMLYCRECDQVLTVDPVYCDGCNGHTEAKLRQAHAEINRLQKELEND